MSNTVISVENLTKRYDLGVISTGTLSRDLNRWWAHLRQQPDPYTKIGQEDKFKRIGESILALDDVSFTVQQGEALGIIGKNGAGKSTLLKILSRVTAPTSGVVKIKGRIGSLLEVGTGFHPELTGRENVFLNGAILGMRNDEVTKKFDEIVDFSGVEKFIDTPVKRYSSGMYVRLAFAVAAHLDPEILVIDEVLAVGDAEFQKKCLGKMGDVAGEGRTVLFVSHNMAAINKLCSRGLLLEDGTIYANDETQEVINTYNNLSLNNRCFIANITSNELRKFHHSGTGEATIEWANIKNQNSIESTTFKMTEGIEVNFGVINPLKLNLSFGIEIQDKNEYPLFHFLSEHEKTKLKFKNTKQNVEIVTWIPALNLFPDTYFINLWVGTHAHRIDKVEKCFKINIIKDPNIHREFETNRGRIYAKGQWFVKYY